MNIFIAYFWRRKNRELPYAGQKIKVLNSPGRIIEKIKLVNCGDHM